MVALRRKVVATVDESMDEASVDATAWLADGLPAAVCNDPAGIPAYEKRTRRR